MEHKRGASLPVVGAGSLLTIFAVLCLTVFTLLSVATVQANGRLGESAAQAVRDYYAADSTAHRILAAIRAGEPPEGVEQTNGVYRFSCPVGQEQQLCVEAAVNGTDYTVLRWQVQPVRPWQNEEELPVWNGDQEG